MLICSTVGEADGEEEEEEDKAARRDDKSVEVDKLEASDLTVVGVQY